jgi:hypothetical protein
MLIYIDLVVKYGAYGLIAILCFVIFLLTRWIINNHIHGLGEQIEKLDGKLTGIGKSLDAEKITRDAKDEEQGKDIVKIQKDIEYMGKDIKRIDDKISKYFNGAR